MKDSFTPMTPIFFSKIIKRKCQPKTRVTFTLQNASGGKENPGTSSSLHKHNATTSNPPLRAVVIVINVIRLVGGYCVHLHN